MRLGPYELISRIGAGGMGEVWAAHRSSLSTNEVFAVKRLPDSLARDPTYRRLLLDEARLSMLLRHRNIVHVFDAGESFGEAYIAMEFVQGFDLSRLRKLLDHTGEQISPTLAAYVIGEVLEGLAYAHNLEHRGELISLIHRDVSPHNVILSIRGEVKLTDFGVARLSSEDTSGTHVKGKARYMPPEQLRGESRSPTVDLFAAGAVLHEMLDGRMFRCDAIDDARLLGMAIDGIVPALRRRIVGALEDLRVGLLEPDPKLRIHSAHAALELLQRWPGYADASGELGALVRRYVEMQAALDGDPAPNEFAHQPTQLHTSGPSSPADANNLEQLLGDDEFAAGEDSLLEPDTAPAPTSSGELDGGFGPAEHIDYSHDVPARKTGARPQVAIAVTTAADEDSARRTPSFTRHVATSPNPVLRNWQPFKLAAGGLALLALIVGGVAASKLIERRPKQPTTPTPSAHEGMRKVRVIGDELASNAGFHLRNMDLLASEDILYSFVGVASGDSQRPLAALARGEAEFAITTLDELLLERAHTSDEQLAALGKIVAIVDVSLGSDALVLDSAEFPQLRSLAELAAFTAKSKSNPVLAFARGTPGELLDLRLTALLTALEPAQREQVGDAADGRAVYDALAAPADADAPIVGALLSEPWLGQAVDAGMTVVASTRDVPRTIVHVLVASPHVLEQPELVDTVVATYYAGILAQQLQPTELRAAVVRGVGITEAEAERTLAGTCLLDSVGAEPWLVARDGAVPQLGPVLDATWASLRSDQRVEGRVEGEVPELAALIDARAVSAAAERDRAAESGSGTLDGCLARTKSKAAANQALGQLALPGAEQPYFLPGEASLTAEQAGNIDELARRLAVFNDNTVVAELIGHGDEASGPQGKTLGQQRAKALAKALELAGVTLPLSTRGAQARERPPALISVSLSRVR